MAVVDAGPTHFRAEDPNDPDFYIDGHLSSGVLSFEVVAVRGGKRGAFRDLLHSRKCFRNNLIRASDAPAIDSGGIWRPKLKTVMTGGRNDLQAGLLPAIHSSGQCFYVGESLRSILFRPTGGRGFLRSSAVEDDLAIFRNPRLARLELEERSSPLQMIVLILVFTVVSADQQCFP